MFRSRQLARVCKITKRKLKKKEIKKGELREDKIIAAPFWSLPVQGTWCLKSKCQWNML